MTWHNQVTILKQSFQQLGGIIGGSLINAFKPFIHTLNAVLQKVISFAEMVTNALGSIFGWKYEASDVGITDDLADSYGDVADAANNAADGTKKAAKEAKKSARAFDELKIISKNRMTVHPVVVAVHQVAVEVVLVENLCRLTPFLKTTKVR